MIPKYNIGQKVIILDPRWKNSIDRNNNYFIHKIKLEDQIVYKLWEQETGATLSYFYESDLTTPEEIRENKLISILEDN
jgi:hypothetical protein